MTQTPKTISPEPQPTFFAMAALMAEAQAAEIRDEPIGPVIPFPSPIVA